MSRSIAVKALGVFAILLLAGCAGTQKQPSDSAAFSQHYSDTLFQVTEKELYSVELLMDQGTLTTGENSFQAVVHNRQDQDVPGAEVTAAAFKPQSPDATRQQVSGMDRDGGLYTFRGLDIEEAGHWQLAVTVNKGGDTDTAVFDFHDVAAPTGKQGASPEPAMQGHAHDNGHDQGQMGHHAETMERPENIDTSDTVMSEKGLFQVAYDTSVRPIPIGRIHQWRIQVLDASGNPVEAARILVDGGMPEHGHGLPTEPEMTDNLGNGVYEIGGMRFSMPGWWVVEFQILTMDKRDRATFNLLLE